MNNMSDSSLFPTETGRVGNVEVGYPRAHALQWHPTRFNFPNPELRGIAGLGALPEVYFSGSENVEDFLEGIANNIKFLEILSDLACAYFKGHLLHRAHDWFEIFGSTLVQNTGTDYEKFKAALTKIFPVMRNRKDLEVQFFSSQQSRDQEPTDFMYDLFKVHKKLGLSVSEETLVDHIFVRLEPQRCRLCRS
ncbi:uncharacterized protein TNCV_4226381 [Trichonephila clavipes]|uniref:Retrotransposon gag domain-containing protein n=1 Tax=Trichonephila clavipes TaxID=2585209 RepID=A0A8X6SSM9_TRICX|nr:uncharacterized protein TNCV_4226381 [Trichonephila clavipes]